jgi:hypothetical protein
MDSEEPAEGQDVYVQGVVFRDEGTGLEDVHLCVGGPDLGRLKQGIWAGFQAMLERHLGRKEFGGRIVVVVLAEVTPQTPPLWEAMREMEDRLKGAVAAGRMRTALGHPVTIAVEYTSREDGA